eukprot:6096349-Pleurochrysis_carterae.AAC.4
MPRPLQKAVGALAGEGAICCAACIKRAGGGLCSCATGFSLVRMALARLPRTLLASLKGSTAKLGCENSRSLSGLASRSRCASRSSGRAGNELSNSSLVCSGPI